MYGIDPFLEVDDMLPGATDERDAPGLTLGYIPMPCLSIVIWRRNVILCEDSAHAAWTRAVLMHSPELPQFSAVTAVDIPPTALEIN